MPTRVTREAFARRSPVERAAIGSSSSTARIFVSVRARLRRSFACAGRLGAGFDRPGHASTYHTPRHQHHHADARGGSAAIATDLGILDFDDGVDIDLSLVGIWLVSTPLTVDDHGTDLTTPGTAPYQRRRPHRPRSTVTVDDDHDTRRPDAIRRATITEHHQRSQQRPVQRTRPVRQHRRRSSRDGSQRRAATTTTPAASALIILLALCTVSPPAAPVGAMMSYSWLQ